MHSKGHASKPAAPRPQAKTIHPVGHGHASSKPSAVHPVARKPAKQAAAVRPQPAHQTAKAPASKRKAAPKASPMQASPMQASDSSPPGSMPTAVAPVAYQTAAAAPTPIVMYMTVPTAPQYVQVNAVPAPTLQPMPLYTPAQSLAPDATTRHFSLKDPSTWNVASARALVHAKSAPNVVGSGGRRTAMDAAARFLFSHRHTMRRKEGTCC